MTGVSLRFGGREYLALPGGVAQLRAGGTSGLRARPVGEPAGVAPLPGSRYHVDLDGLPLGTDDNGLPIHGLLVGASAGAWTASASVASPLVFSRR